MQKLYTMMIEYNDGSVVLMPGTEGKTHTIADKENLHLLYSIGKRLLKENAIASYQVLEIVSPVIDSVNMSVTSEILHTQKV